MQWFLQNQAIIQTALVYVVLGYSLQIPLRAGVFTFASGGFYIFGAYCAGILVKSEWNPWLSIGISMIVAGISGYALSLIMTRLRSLYLAMSTLAFIFLVKLAAEAMTITGGSIGLLAIPPSTETWHLGVAALLVTVLAWSLSRGRLDRLTEAIRTDEVLANTVGISIRRQHNTVFVLSSVLGALAGGLFALTVTVVIPDQLGFELLLVILTILVIGGSRHWAGVLVGAVAVAWLPTWLAGFGDWRPVVDGVVVVALAVVASNGLVGVAGAAVNRLKSSWSTKSGGRDETSVANGDSIGSEAVR